VRRAPTTGGLSAPLFFLLMLPALLSWGCDGPKAPPLARMDKVGPNVIEPGDVLVIEGEGFVEGPAELSFDGEMVPVGVGPAERRRVSLDATAVSSTRIELPITGTVMSRLSAEPAGFSGSLRVAFPTALAHSSVRVQATVDEVFLDLRPAGGAVAAVARRIREAEASLADLGIVLSGDAAGMDLLVEQVRAGSPADRAGLDPRDRLLALDGKAIAGVGDLSGIDFHSAHSLSVMSAAGVPRELELLPDPAAAWPADEFAALMLAAAALGLFLAFAAPVRRRPRVAEANPRLANPLLRALGIGALTVPMLVLPAALLGGIEGLAATLGVLGLTVAGAAGAALFGTGGVLSRIATVVRGLLPLLAALVMAGAFGASIDLSDAVASQGTTPWGWHAWSNPFALAATMAAVALLWPDGDAPEASAAARAMAWITACGGSILLTACALGGWLSPGLEPGTATGAAALIAGVAVFAVKCWMLLLAARWWAGAGRSERRAGRRGRKSGSRDLVAAGLAATLGLALAWRHAGLPGEIETVGRVLASGVFAAMVTALMGRGLASAVSRPATVTVAAETVRDPAIPSSAP